MKINDVVIKEAGFADAYALRNTKNPPPVDTTKPGTVAGTGLAGDTAKTGTGASGFPTQSPSQAAMPTPTTTDKKKGTAKFDPAVQARQQELIAAGAKIKADGYMGPKTREAEKQFGAQIDTAKAQAQQAQGGPTTVTNPAQADQNAPAPETPTTTSTTVQGPAATGQDAPSAELDRMKQLAFGQNTLNQQASQQGAAMAQAAKPVTPAPNTNPLGVTAQAGNAFGQAAPTPDKPNTQTGQSAQPNAPMKTAQDFAPQPEISADTGLSTVAPQIGTGKDGKGPGLTDRFGKPVTTGSDDEMAWRSKQTGIVDVTKYPGPGKWDPKTGRTVNKDAQGNVIKDKGLGDRISDFFGGLGKQSSGQAAQPAAGDQSGGSTTGNKAFLPGAAGGAKEDIARLRKLSGLE